MEEMHQKKVENPTIIPNPKVQKRSLNINAEDIIKNGQNDTLILFTNFSIDEFNELYEKMLQLSSEELILTRWCHLKHAI